MADQPSTDLVVQMPTGNALALIFSDDTAAETILSQIEAEVRAFVPDTSTKKGRDAIASLAYRVARSKTALDEAGKDMGEEWRRKLDAVNENRKKFRDRLDDLKKEARKPLDEWEKAEEERLKNLKARLSTLEDCVVTWENGSAVVAAEIAQIEGIAIDDSWGEYLELAAKAKDVTLARLRSDLDRAKRHEEEQAELAELRAAKAKREAEEAAAREEARRAEALRFDAQRMREHIKNCGLGLIDGDPQPYGILVYELETKIKIDAGWGEYQVELEELRARTADDLRQKMEEKHRRDAEEEAAREKVRQAEAKEAAERAAKIAREEAEAAAAAKIKAAEEAAKKAAEEADRKAREEAEAREAAKRAAEDRRRADLAHRGRIVQEIAEAMIRLDLRPDMDMDTVKTIAEAIVDGKIPHVEAKL